MQTIHPGEPFVPSSRISGPPSLILWLLVAVAATLPGLLAKGAHIQPVHSQQRSTQ